MKRIKAILQAIKNYLSLRPYINAGIIDLGGQGKNKYGK